MSGGLHFAGMRVVILEDPTPRVVRRSWRERLLSRPWRPLETHRTIPAAPRLFPPGQAVTVNGQLHIYRSDWALLTLKLELERRLRP